MRLTHAALGLALLATFCPGCESPGRWGTPEYFEQLTGVAFVPAGPSIRCQQETGFDYVAYRQVRLPQSALDVLRAQSSALSTSPHQLDYERERRLVRWARTPLGSEAEKALQLALSGAIAAIDESGCGAIASTAARESVLRAIDRPKTYYSYQLLAPSGEIRAEALDFRVLDLEAGVLYELVNFS